MSERVAPVGEKVALTLPIIHVHFWAKDDDTGRAAAGGYLRCDTVQEAVEFADQCRDRGIALKAVLS